MTWSYANSGWPALREQQMTYDFRHEAMHNLSAWPVLGEIVRARKSKARRLDSRTIAALYADSFRESWLKMSNAGHDFAKSCIEAHQTD